MRFGGIGLGGISSRPALIGGGGGIGTDPEGIFGNDLGCWMEATDNVYKDLISTPALNGDSVFEWRDKLLDGTNEAFTDDTGNRPTFDTVDGAKGGPALRLGNNGTLVGAVLDLKTPLGTGSVPHGVFGFLIKPGAGSEATVLSDSLGTSNFKVAPSGFDNRLDLTISGTVILNDTLVTPTIKDTWVACVVGYQNGEIFVILDNKVDAPQTLTSALTYTTPAAACIMRVGRIGNAGPNSMESFVYAKAFYAEASDEIVALMNFLKAKIPNPAPDIDVDVSELDFGNQPITDGATSAMTVVITNEGNATLTISNVSISGADLADFTISSDTGEGTLAGGATRTVQVTFDPTILGAKAAQLDIASDSPGEAVVSVSLIGEGINVPLGLVDYDDDLLVKLLMNEVSGNALNVGLGGDFTEVNTPGDAVGVVNRGRQCLKVNNEYFTRNNADVSPGNNSFSLAFWYNPDSATTAEFLTSLWHQASSAAQGFYVERTGSDTLNFRVYYNASGNDVTLASVATLSASSWNCIICVYDQPSTSLTIYVNNVKVSVVNGLLSNYNAPVSQLDVGKLVNSGNEITGILDIFCLWDNVVLNDADAAEFFHNGTGLEVWPESFGLVDHDANLLVKCLMNEGSTGDAINEVGGNFTQVNAPADAVGIVGRGRECLTANSEYFTRTNADVRPGNNSFSLAFWYKPDSATTSLDYLIGLWDIAGADRTFYINRTASQTLSAFVFTTDNTAEILESDELVDSTDWHCVVLVYDQEATALYLYINNVKKTLVAPALSNLNIGNGIFTIGTLQAQSQYADGILDIVCFWDDVVLSDSDAAEFFNNGAGVENWPIQTLADLESNAIVKLLMNEGSTGDAVNVGSGGNLAANNAPLDAVGLIGRARHFNVGDFQYVWRDNADVRFGNNSFSVALWYKPDVAVAGGSEWLMGLMDSSDSLKTFVIRRNGSGGGNPIACDVFYDASGGSINISSASGVTDTEWHCIVLVYDQANTSISLYVDDVKSTIVDANLSNLNISANPLVVGVVFGNSNYADGAIDIVYMWDNVALTDDQASEYFNNGAGAESFPVQTLSDLDDKLLVKLLLNEGGTGNAINDAPAGGGDFTANNAPADVAGLIGRGRELLLATSQTFKRTNVDVQPGNNSFSVAFWYKSRVGAIGAAENLFNQWDNPDADRSWWIERDANEKIGFSVYHDTNSGSTTLYNSLVFTPDTDWHCIVCVYDQAATKISVYVDDVKMELVNANLSNFNTGNSGITAMGELGPFGGFADGSFDSVHLWDDHALTDAQASEFFNGGAGVEDFSQHPLTGFDSALIVKCLMNEGDTSDAVNIGSGGNFTAVNSPADVSGIVGRGRECSSGSLSKFNRDNADVRPGNNSFSLALWFKPNSASVPSFDTFYSYFSAVTLDFSFFIYRNTAGNIIISLYTDSIGNNETLTHSVVTLDTDWHCLVLTYRQNAGSGDITVYLDDVKETKNHASLANFNNGLGEVEIGSRAGQGDGNPNSLLDIVCFWDGVALPDSAARAFFNDGLGIEEWTPPRSLKDEDSNLLVKCLMNEGSSGADAVNAGSGGDFTSFLSPPDAAGLIGRARNVGRSGGTHFNRINADVIPGNNSFSLAFWVKFDNATIPPEEYMMGLWTLTAGEQTFYVYRAGDEKIGFVVYYNGASGAVDFRPFLTVTDTDWHCIVCVYDQVGEKVSIYLDDTKLSTTDSNLSNLNVDAGSVLTLGGISTQTGLNAEADLDIVCFWDNVALSDSQASEFYNGGSGLEDWS